MFDGTKMEKRIRDRRRQFYFAAMPTVAGFLWKVPVQSGQLPNDEFFAVVVRIGMIVTNVILRVETQGRGRWSNPVTRRLESCAINMEIEFLEDGEESNVVGEEFLAACTEVSGKMPSARRMPVSS